jgi:hypothetical protein
MGRIVEWTWLKSWQVRLMNLFNEFNIYLLSTPYMSASVF